MKDGDPYQPSSGTEGIGFMEGFCVHCEREREYNESEGEDIDKACEILSATMRVDPGHPDYPKQWIYKDGKPVCTAYIAEGKEIPIVDDKTLPMFPEIEKEKAL